MVVGTGVGTRVIGTSCDESQLCDYGWMVTADAVGADPGGLDRPARLGSIMLRGRARRLMARLVGHLRPARGRASMISESQHLGRSAGMQTRDQADSVA